MARKPETLIVGGGMIGLVLLRTLRKAGIDATLVDRADGVGGLWRRLPAWQDIQTPKEDWTLNGIPIDGTKAPQLVGQMERWVAKYRLAPYLRLRTEVQGLRREGDRWHVTTSQGPLEADAVVLCCGPHGKPVVPAIARRDAKIEEVHSGRLFDRSRLQGRVVTVVGGGASAFDALELALAEGAKNIHWVVREPRWMVPSKKQKTARSQLRFFGMMQLAGKTDDEISAMYAARLPELYRIFGMDSILPKTPLNILHGQLVPGRPELIARLKEIVLHRGHSATAIEGKQLVLSNGETVETDVVVWATGYQLDLSFTKLPEYENVTSGVALRALLGAQLKSLHYRQLYFVGPTVGDVNILTGVASALIGRTMANVLLGRCALPDEPVLRNLNLVRMLEYYAQFDRRTYPPGLWRLWFRLKWSFYARFPKVIMRF